MMDIGVQQRTDTFVKLHFNRNEWRFDVKHKTPTGPPLTDLVLI